MLKVPTPPWRAATAFGLAAAILSALVAATPRLHAQGVAEASAATPAAGVESHSYDVTLRGIRAAAVRIDGQERGGRYSARLLVQTTGLGAAIRRVRFEAASEGRARGGRLFPARYDENADTGKRRTQSILEYRRGVPVVVAYRAERDHRLDTVDPATQGGTLDPLTSLYAILRDVPRERACTAAVTTFDGRRRSATRLWGAEAQGDRLLCRGEYRRIAGFDPDDMAERTTFPFVLTYAPLPDGRMRVVEVTLDTQYGQARLTRR